MCNREEQCEFRQGIRSMDQVFAGSHDVVGILLALNILGVYGFGKSI